MYVCIVGMCVCRYVLLEVFYAFGLLQPCVCVLYVHMCVYACMYVLLQVLCLYCMLPHAPGVRMCMCLHVCMPALLKDLFVMSFIAHTKSGFMCAREQLYVPRVTRKWYNIIKKFPCSYASALYTQKHAYVHIHVYAYTHKAPACSAC